MSEVKIRKELSPAMLQACVDQCISWMLDEDQVHPSLCHSVHECLETSMFRRPSVSVIAAAVDKGLERAQRYLK